MRFALVTPSYYVDLEPCRLLCESVARYVPLRIPHYLIVDRADVPLFAPLASSRTQIVTKEEVLEGRLWQVPFRRRWWLTRRGRPVRGWIAQQLVKLMASNVVDEDVLTFVDSGNLFVRPFDPATFARGERVRMYREESDYYRNGTTRRWAALSSRLVGVRPPEDYPVGYVSPLISWRRDNLVRLREHVERVSGRSMLDTLAGLRTLSEYYLYGVYADLILGDRAGHYADAIERTLSYWGRTPLDELGLRELRARLRPDHVLMYVDEKSRTPRDLVRRVLLDGSGSTRDVSAVA